MKINNIKELKFFLGEVVSFQNENFYDFEKIENVEFLFNIDIEESIKANNIKGISIKANKIKARDINIKGVLEASNYIHAQNIKAGCIHTDKDLYIKGDLFVEGDLYVGGNLNSLGNFFVGGIEGVEGKTNIFSSLEM